jgi:hypothetical protein
VLGASTGGVSALETVLTAFPGRLPPDACRAAHSRRICRRHDQAPRRACLPRIMPAEDATATAAGACLHRPRSGRHLVVQPGEPARCRLKAAHRPPWAPALGRCAVRNSRWPTRRRGRLADRHGCRRRRRPPPDQAGRRPDHRPERSHLRRLRHAARWPSNWARRIMCCRWTGLPRC